MTFAGLTRYLTGVLVPVSALKSTESLGVGEFADLPALARWCTSVGLDLIQILPVNDTGWQPSPYSALTAFGLHPIYIRITDLPEYTSLQGAIRKEIDEQLTRVRESHESDQRIRYGELNDAKYDLLRRIYEANAPDGALGPRLASTVDAYLDESAWVLPFAAFKALKERHNGAPWTEWNELRDVHPDSLRIFAEKPDNRADLRFHAWVQLRLEEQFAAAAKAVDEAGVILKGDLPILINEDSADAWMHRDYFSVQYRAGSPPDAENPLGQNWGLPTYDWNALARDNFSWWRERLEHASRFYAAYRIDHVLGFFRVWSIPSTDFTGYLGHYVPGASATRQRLNEVGMDDGRIRWLAEPHIRGEWIRGDLGDEADAVADAALDQIDDQDLFVFTDSIRGERDLSLLGLSDEATGWLHQQYRNRALVELEDGNMVQAWSFGDCSRFRELQDHEKEPMWHIASQLVAESEDAWEEQGRRVLSMMRDATDMLPCAEDLGSIPDCVPGVLQSLHILGLRIPRWARRWHEEGQPYIPVSEYPFFTVCAPSVHDTTTLRGWWDEEREKKAFWHSIGLSGEPPAEYTTDAAGSVLGALLETTSALCVLQMQDLLALTSDKRSASPEDERVNVPGTMSAFNWGYRMPCTLEGLSGDHILQSTLAPMVADRRKRPVAGH